MSLMLLRGRLLGVFRGQKSLHPSYVDALEQNLATELENARLVRLMSKLGFINERAEFELDSRWSETGDRYIVKLFRDYVFHSVGGDGRPILDMSHVVTCLNKVSLAS